MHNHPNIAWSGVYYVTGNPSNDSLIGVLEFYDPRPFTAMSPPFYNKRSKSTIASVTDGTSNTVAWVEDAGRPSLYRGSTVIANSRSSGASWADPDLEFWVDGFTVDGVTSLGPCAMNWASITSGAHMIASIGRLKRATGY